MNTLLLNPEHTLNSVIFDKTGTLTTGEQKIVSITTHGISTAEAMQIAASIESNSEHPIAQAIRREAKKRHITPTKAQAFENMPGLGVKAQIESQTFYLGGSHLRKQAGWLLPKALNPARMQAENNGHTVIYLAQQHKGIVAVFELADTIRPESFEMIARLHHMGIHVIMLTGDSVAAARAIADELRIETYFAELMPDQKASTVTALKETGWRVFMVGHAADDASALANADIGIGIGKNVALDRLSVDRSALTSLSKL